MGSFMGYGSRRRYQCFAFRITAADELDPFHAHEIASANVVVLRFCLVVAEVEICEEGEHVARARLIPRWASTSFDTHLGPSMYPLDHSGLISKQTSYTIQ
jgi:hypothetical protein